jgi:hypothetical protein
VCMQQDQLISSKAYLVKFLRNGRFSVDALIM